MIHVRNYLVVKDGTAPEDNDDAAAADPRRGRAAISDGACESGFSKIWSRVLVDQYVRSHNGLANDWASWFAKAQQQWCDELKDVTIPWYGEEQFRRGAFATFLGLVLEGTGKRMKYSAEAVGDSCLFHIRGEQLLQSFPLQRSNQFDVVPQLVGSRSPLEEILRDRASSIEGELRQEDALLLMSDALAQWSLTQAESGDPPWKEIVDLVLGGCSDDEFDQWIAWLRAERGLANDDVTLMMIRIATTK